MNAPLPAHSKLGASSAHRWMACPGSVRLGSGLPDQSSKYAEEGTRAHEHAAECLANDLDADVAHGLEMAEAVQVYLDTVRGDAGDTAPLRYIEQKFHLKEVHPDLFGTADCVQVWPKQKFMRVYDYKHGAGVAVEVEDNEQLKYYALGALITYGKPITEVELVIVQPRCPHAGGQVRRHRFKAFELMDFEGDLVKAAKATEAPDAPLKLGEHCKWCKAAALCPEAKKKAQAAAKIEFAADKPYDPAELAEALALAETLDSWVTSVRAFAYGEATHGRTPPGWKLVDKRPSRKWKADEHTIETELSRIGLTVLDIYEPREVKSPAQIEKVIGKGKKNADRLAVVETLTEKVSSGQTLVPESDARPAVKNSAQEDFGNAP